MSGSNQVKYLQPEVKFYINPRELETPTIYSEFVENYNN